MLKMLNPSGYFLFLAGVLMLIALPILLNGSLSVWVAAKIAYLVGVILIVFNR